jgi:hypothetical protein
MTDYLDALEEQLVNAANQRTRQARRSATSGGWRVPSQLVTAAGLLLSVATVALAATGMLGAGPSGSTGPRLSSTAGVGIPGVGEAQRTPTNVFGGSGSLPSSVRGAHDPIQDFEVLDAWPVVVHFAAGTAPAMNVATG